MGKRYEHEARKFRFYYIFLFTIFERAYNFGFWSFQVDAMDGANLVFLFFLFLVFFSVVGWDLGGLNMGGISVLTEIVSLIDIWTPSTWVLLFRTSLRH